MKFKVLKVTKSTTKEGAVTVTIAQQKETSVGKMLGERLHYNAIPDVAPTVESELDIDMNEFVITERRNVIIDEKSGHVVNDVMTKWLKPKMAA